MNIAIINPKGGQGKSLIAHQLITTFGYKGFEIDPYGSLADRLPDDVTFVDIKSNYITKEDVKNTIFDFGGFSDPKEDEAIQKSDFTLSFIWIFNSLGVFKSK